MTALSFQLYSARNFPPTSAVFALLAANGYTEVEGFGGNYGAADEAAGKALKSELDAHGLTMPTGHFGIDLLEGNPDQIIAFAKAVGMESIYCPHLMPKDRPTDAAGWHAFGVRLQKAGAPYKAAGFDFGWHNHDFEFVALPDGTFPQDHILAGGPDLSWEADIAWVVRGGADPFAWIEKYGKRITSVHVKDIAPAGENKDEDGWADVGHGTVPWAKLVAALKGTSVRHFVVEHDNPNDLERLVKRSIASFKAY
jgi:sugar phosphate isomerase/epimerase